MPRRYSRRRYKRKPRGGWYHVRNAMSTAQNALKIARTVKSLINVEYKHKDNAVLADDVLSTGDVFCVSSLAEGDSETERNGKSVKVKSLSLHGELARQDTGVVYDSVRIMIVMDRHQHGSDPTIAELIDGTDVIDFRNLDNTDRFRILMDKRYILNDVRPNKVVNFNVKLDTDIEYIGATAAEASNGGNNIYIVYFSNRIGSWPHFDWITRMRYIDN